MTTHDNRKRRKPLISTTRQTTLCQASTSIEQMCTRAVIRTLVKHISRQKNKNSIFKTLCQAKSDIETTFHCLNLIDCYWMSKRVAIPCRHFCNLYLAVHRRHTKCSHYKTVKWRPSSVICRLLYQHFLYRIRIFSHYKFITANFHWIHSAILLPHAFVMKQKQKKKDIYYKCPWSIYLCTFWT